MANLASKYPFEGVTTANVKLKPQGINLPEGHPVIVTSETESFGRVVTEVDAKPRSGFLEKGEYKKA